jgi:haloacetate dehalogenase
LEKRDAMFEGFSSRTIRTARTSLFVRIAGSGPPLLLLHGFPETHLMWRDVAPALARHFTVVCMDLPGYGNSGCPPSMPDHASGAKRSMALETIDLMTSLGFPRFAVAGHDRGGRVAYRMALDHPARVERVAVLDVLPTDTAWTYADDRFAVGYWPWSLLAQPAPLPERMLTAAADAVVGNALGTWGSDVLSVPEEVRAAYVEALRDPAHAHAICEEYRAGATIDRAHDRADRTAGRRIRCPLLALWSAGGPLDTWYEAHSGPLALWKSWADDVRGEAMQGGHFFPEAHPVATAEALHAFLALTRVPTS